MSGPIHLIVQNAIMREHDVSRTCAELGIRITQLEEKNWRAHLEALEEQIAGSGERPMLFCSLQASGYARRACPTLARGVLRPDAFLQHHHYSALLTPGAAINEGGLYLPWGHIPSMVRTLEHLYPEGVFIRPSSGLKPFTGFAVEHGQLMFEHRAMSQAAGIFPTELCFIASKRTLPAAEFRVWIVDATPITSASYGWEDGAEHASPPAGLMEAASRLADSLALHEQTYTADFVHFRGEFRLVELNALSTSGWYAGMDPEKLLHSLEEILV